MGIGREMVKVLVREAKRIGLRNLEVELLSTNQASIHTYQKAGFREVGRIPAKVHRNGKFLDSLIMARQLSHYLDATQDIGSASRFCLTRLCVRSSRQSSADT